MRRFLLAAVVALAVSSCAVAPFQGSGPARPFYDGIWQDAEDSGYEVRIDDSQILIASGGQVQSGAKILEESQNGLRVCEFGREKRYDVTRSGEDLIVLGLEAEKPRFLRRLAEVPPDLVLNPLRLPEPTPLPEERILAIQRELWRRLNEDQGSIRAVPVPTNSEPSWLQPRPETRRFGDEAPDFRKAEVMAANTRYLKSLVSEVGWIDVERFGYPASNAAFLLVQHSYDFPLMLAVLPRLHADVLANRTEGETYALLLDRFRLALGDKQVYGSQVIRDEDGQYEMLPVVDPAHLDERRAALHMQPIAQYLRAFGSAEVRISSACW